jgi:hypothetical protein
MTERVTVEYNGEMVTVDVPDGTTDEQIKSYLAGREPTGAKQMTTAEASLSDPLTNMGVAAAVRPTAEIAGALARNAGKLTPGQVATAASQPFSTARNAIQNTVDFMAPKTTAPALSSDMPIRAIEPARQMTFGEMAKPSNIGRGVMAAGRGLASMALAPEVALQAPYQMAAYEQEKIRANPNAPQYRTTPYAQQYRGEAPTQGAAGAMNQRRAVAGQQYGGISAEDQARLEDDKMKRMIRYAALKKALGQ